MEFFYVVFMCIVNLFLLALEVVSLIVQYMFHIGIGEGFQWTVYMNTLIVLYCFTMTLMGRRKHDPRYQGAITTWKEMWNTTTGNLIRKIPGVGTILWFVAQFMLYPWVYIAGEIVTIKDSVERGMKFKVHAFRPYM